MAVGVKQGEIMCSHDGEVLLVFMPLVRLAYMKEMVLEADRSSTIPEVKQFAWDIFQALDKLPNDDANVG